VATGLSARIRSVLLGCAGLFAVLALSSYHPADLSLLTSEPNHPVRNISGVAGAWCAFLGREGVGWASFLIPLFCAVWAWRVWRGQLQADRWLTRTVASLCVIVGAGVLLALAVTDPTEQARLGGVSGYLLVRAGRYYFGPVTTGILAASVIVLAWPFAVDQTSLPQLVVQWIKRALAGRSRALGAPAALRMGEAATDPATSRLATSSPRPVPVSTSPREEALGAAETLRVKIRSTVTPKPKTVPSPVAKLRGGTNGFQLPSLDLLDTPPPLSQRQLTEDLHVNAKIVEDTLRDFGIEARCVNIDRGPAVTRYELSPAPGVKLTRIVSLADDLALVLKAANCHIVAPIPGKGLVGVEVPNSTATVVYLKEIVSAREFQQVGSPLALAIGKDVSGHPVVADLGDCPHLLVAGATGSGKTVCLNSLLLGILCQATPDDVKFLMIDPKMVELVLFNDMPHLVAPVVTDAKRAAVALHWAVQEMERRYQSLSKAGARNITSYNQKVRGSQEPRMPYLVIVIDELADLMMVASQDVEGAVTRLAQLSRAVGIHMLLATQRPSVDVITGVIKANFPARIAFQVPSKVDSRTILDANGADKLLGRGDLMFLRPGTAKPIRAQGAFVTDAEIERVVAHLKAQQAPTYDEQLLAKQDKPVEAMLGEEKDELYEMAKKIVLEARQASTSLLQRRLRLGYSRAARILDLMEQEGIVGPPQGSRPREILVDQNAMSQQT